MFSRLDMGTEDNSFQQEDPAQRADRKAQPRLSTSRDGLLQFLRIRESEQFLFLQGWTGMIPTTTLCLFLDLCFLLRSKLGLSFFLWKIGGSHQGTSQFSWLLSFHLGKTQLFSSVGHDGGRLWESNRLRASLSIQAWYFKYLTLWLGTQSPWEMSHGVLDTVVILEESLNRKLWYARQVVLISGLR